jgi:glycerol kinase
VAWSLGGHVEYALDGGVFAAGSMLEWMCRELGMAPSPGARAVLAGMHGGTTRAEVALAALEGIAWRVADIVAAVRESVDVRSVRVDGGLTNEPLLLQLQADAIGAPVEAAGADATVLGAAVLAAVGSGAIGSLEAAAELLPVDRRVEPRRDDPWRTAEHERWRSFVAGAAELR